MSYIDPNPIIDTAKVVSVVSPKDETRKKIVSGATVLGIGFACYSVLSMGFGAALPFGLGYLGYKLFIDENEE